MFFSFEEAWANVRVKGEIAALGRCIAIMISLENSKYTKISIDFFWFSKKKHYIYTYLRVYY